jgi:hypothetical protein
MSQHERARLAWRACSFPKRGHSAEEYEDAYAGDVKLGRFAVADGASESSFAKQWAKLLVGGYVYKEPRPDTKPHWLRQLQERWAKQVDGLELPWFAEAKRSQGAFATFLGLALKPSDHPQAGTWKATAVGDCCFFQVREEKVIHSFPVKHSADFGNRPDLIGSRQPIAPRELKRDRGEWRHGDRLWLMTDAIAQWFLHRLEQGHHPWRSLEQCLFEPATEPWVDQLRDHGMRNDDVTLIHIMV